MAVLNLGNKGRRRRPLNIASIPNCEFWVDAARTETHNYASGVNLTQLNDLSGKNRHLTKTGSGNDTIYPTYVSAERGVLFLNSAFDQMIAGAIGDWNFLHNGNGCTVMMLVKVDSAQAANAALLSTSSEATGGYGTNIWYYDTNQQYYVSTRAGAGQVFANSGANNSLTRNTPTILSLHMENRAGTPADLVTRYNGTTDLKIGNASAFSNSNSTGPLFIGKLASGVAKCKFLFKKCAIFSRRLSKAEENLILEDWAKSEGIALTRYGEMPLAVLSGQSNAKGRGVIADTSFAATPSVSNASIFNNTSLTWSTLQAGINNDAYSNATLGIEMNLAKQFTTLSGLPFYMVKFAVDGTPISSWDTANSNYTNLQAAMLRAYWNLEDSGYVVKPFFIWYQGESDSLDDTLAANYATNFQVFLSNILSTPGYAQSPTYIVQIHQSPPATGINAVRNNQLLTCMTTPYSAYCRHVEVDDIATNIDQHHVTAASLNAIGNRIARRYLGIAE